MAWFSAWSIAPVAPAGCVTPSKRLTTMALAGYWAMSPGSMRTSMTFLSVPLLETAGRFNNEGIRLDLHEDVGFDEPANLHQRSGRPYVAKELAVCPSDLLPIIDVGTEDACAGDG